MSVYGHENVFNSFKQDLFRVDVDILSIVISDDYFVFPILNTHISNHNNKDTKRAASPKFPNSPTHTSYIQNCVI